MPSEECTGESKVALNVTLFIPSAGSVASAALIRTTQPPFGEVFAEALQSLECLQDFSSACFVLPPLNNKQTLADRQQKSVYCSALVC